MPRAPAAVPPSYPPAAAPAVDNLALYDRLDADALFFVFYFHPGTRQQQMAARALKRLGWRFHTKFSTWFQRHDEPQVTTDEYEQGTYAYFDVGGADGHEGWVQRVKPGFVFEYEFMENAVLEA